MNTRDILLGLHEVEGIGWKSIDKIRKAGFLSDLAFELKQEDWEDIGLKPILSAKLAGHFTPEWIRGRIHLNGDAGIGIMTLLDEDYPARLREIAQPPWVLYYRGRVELMHAPGIAIVGTRVPTAYGRRVGAVLAEELADGGLTVVSGLARGIDSVCHEAALQRAGGTVAVIATPMNKVYPPENRELMEQIVRHGLVVTEYPLGTKSHPGLFPQRNRIIAGLTLGTLVVEADSRSGSLITAAAALEYNREVFAVPGPITSPKSRGTLDLLKQGAGLVTEVRDILDLYSHYIPEKEKNSDVSSVLHKDSHPLQPEKNLTSAELRLYHILHQEPCTLDELLEKTGLDFGHLHSVLLSLIVKKAVTTLPGSVYKVIG
ncbi:DNA-processing protein DprA [Paenibacillus sp. HN-1]|uniref:DNA-processing protein DprA n=1 Tax=Paenibacillus TaxID=44249 RepID=UPI001CA862D7|nr:MULTISPECIES: DNA-processing protein DprA [Paenibacillus]MBY9081873.1 DNA-processing protein DprA [Paenibacillus sp. CGMCC 1.18879]MBY9085969.1 DNA-processing protein DprA [Paenibacillus sinensis]